MRKQVLDRLASSQKRLAAITNDSTKLPKEGDKIDRIEISKEPWPMADIYFDSGAWVAVHLSNEEATSNLETEGITP